jgi:hypothetical protein
MAMPTSTPSTQRTMRWRLGARGLSVTDLSITASPRCFYRLVVSTRVTTWQPGRANSPDQAIPTDKAASGAQKSVRPVQCGSQAVAQNHQGPLRSENLAGLGTAAAIGKRSPRQYLGANDLKGFDYRARS